MSTKLNPTGPRWARSKYYRNIFLVIALLAVVSVASVLGNYSVATDDYGYGYDYSGHIQGTDPSFVDGAYDYSPYAEHSLYPENSVSSHGYIGIVPALLD